MRLFLELAYFTIALMAVLGWLLPGLISAKSTEAFALGIVLIPAICAVTWIVARDTLKRIKKEKTNA